MVRSVRGRVYSKKCVKVNNVKINNFDYGKAKKGEKTSHGGSDPRP